MLSVIRRITKCNGACGACQFGRGMNKCGRLTVTDDTRAHFTVSISALASCAHPFISSVDQRQGVDGSFPLRHGMKSTARQNKPRVYIEQTAAYSDSGRLSLSGLTKARNRAGPAHRCTHRTTIYATKSNNKPKTVLTDIEFVLFFSFSPAFASVSGWHLIQKSLNSHAATAAGTLLLITCKSISALYKAPRELKQAFAAQCSQEDAAARQNCSCS